MSEEFIGAGWAFPLDTSPTGGIALVSGDREIEEAIRLTIGTAPGERPMRPEFGCAIHDFVFSPADGATAGRIAYEVEVALERWEPRIDIVGVDVVPDPADQSVLYIEISYTKRGTNDPRNLVFPFYTIPEHEEPKALEEEASHQ
ncbi:MAG: GPW/gp25 family protein [Actinomycetota bacterium]